MISNHVAGGTINLNGNQAVRRLDFGSLVNHAIPGYTISGNTLTIGDGGIHHYGRSNDATINSALLLAADSTIEQNSPWQGNRSFNINGTIGNAGHHLTLHIGAWHMYVNSAISGTGPVTVTKAVNTTDSLYLRANNTFSGPLSIRNGNAVLDNSGLVSGTSAITVDGGRLTIGSTSSSLADEGGSTFGRISNDTPIALRTARALKLVGRDNHATVERIGPVWYQDGRSVITVVNGNAATATLHVASLTRDPDSLPVLVVNSDKHTLGSASRVMLGDGGAGLLHVGGTNTRGTDKAILNAVLSATVNIAEGLYAGAFARYDSTHGFMPLNPNTDYVNGASETDFPAVHADGNDNVRLPWSGVCNTVGVETTLQLSGDTTLNSLLFHNDRNFTTQSDKAKVTIAAPAGTTLTVKSGMVHASARSDGDYRYYVTINVATLSFDRVEGVLAPCHTGYGHLTINSALVGTNGLNVTTRSTNPEEGRCQLNGDNRKLKGQITVSGGSDNIGQLHVGHAQALGGGSNRLFLANARVVPWNVNLTVRSLAGSGSYHSQWNSGSAKGLKIGGNGTGSQNNTIQLLAGGKIEPGVDGKAGVLTFSDFPQVKLLGGELEVDLLSPGACDRLDLTGTTDKTPTLTISGASLKPVLHYVPAVGEQFLFATVSEAIPISGEFLEQDSVEAVYGNRKVTFDILYNRNLAGGTDNDIVLRVADVRPATAGMVVIMR